MLKNVLHEVWAVENGQLRIDFCRAGMGGGGGLFRPFDNRRAAAVAERLLVCYDRLQVYVLKSFYDILRVFKIPSLLKIPYILGKIP